MNKVTNDKVEETIHWRNDEKLFSEYKDVILTFIRTNDGFVKNNILSKKVLDWLIAVQSFDKFKHVVNFLYPDKFGAIWLILHLNMYEVDKGYRIFAKIC